MAGQHLKRLSAIYATALQAYQAGLNVIPVRADGSKRPALDGWKVYQQRRVTLSEVQQWFHRPERGLAVITGEVSGGLEALDIDSPEAYRAWIERIHEYPSLWSIYRRIVYGYLEATPDGGRHLLYRCTEVARNQTLARRPRGDSAGYCALIETRANGGMLIIAPSGGLVHPNGKPYRLLSGGVASIATITPGEREQIFDLARTFDESPFQVHETRPQYETAPLTKQTDRPGDLFNRSARWEEILCPHGWVPVRVMDDVTYWRRPGKRGPGISATTNYASNDLLYVFSTATLFEPERGYTKFTAYTLLEHDGNFAAAAKTLAEEGYTP